MEKFTHFEDGQFISENTHRKTDYPAGEFEDIFDSGKVVVSLSVDQIRDALCDDELLGKISADQNKVEEIYNSLP